MKEEKPRLLVVDDEQSQVDSIKTYFARRNFLVFSTTTGEEALVSIKDHKPNLVLLDIKLSGSLDGKDVLRTLRHYDKDTKVAILTGNLLTEKEIKEITDLGIVEFLYKPVKVQTLDQVIKKVLAENYPKTIRFEAIQHKEEGPIDISLRRLVHELSNVTGDITNKCELYILDTEEGLYKDMTEKERLDRAVRVIKSVMKSTERLTGLVKKLSSLARKEK